MIHAIAIASMALGQVPDAVTNEAVKAFDEGGFKAVAGVLLVMCAALAVTCWRLYLAVREMSAKLLDFATKSVDDSAQARAQQREQTAAMTALAQEVRARSEVQRASG